MRIDDILHVKIIIFQPLPEGNPANPQQLCRISLFAPGGADDPAQLFPVRYSVSHMTGSRMRQDCMKSVSNPMK